MSASLAYATLSQENPSFKPSRIQQLSDLYVGGYQILENAGEYIHQLQSEHPVRYKERLKSTAFVGYMAQIVDSLTGGTFSDPLQVSHVEGTPEPDFWEDFGENADLRGASVEDVCRQALTDALIYGRTFIACDFPTLDGIVTTRAEEDASGASRAYVVPVEPAQLIDWEYSEKFTKRLDVGDGHVDIELGELDLAVIRRTEMRRGSPAASRGIVRETFKVWEMDPSGFAKWSLYAIEYKQDRPPSPKDLVPLVEEGLTSFQRIPLVELALPVGLWVGNKIGPMNLEHWQRRGLLNSSENRGLLSIPVCKLGPEISEPMSALPSDVQSDPNRGETLASQLGRRGYVVIGAGDDIYFAEPTGAAHEGAATRLDKLVDEMFRVTHLMASSVSSTANAVGRSGASKAEDRNATVLVWKTLGAIVRDFAVRMYHTISQARGEAVEFGASGCSNFDLYDRAEVVDEAKSISSVGINSETFRKEYEKQVAQRLLPDMAPSVKADVIAEIDASEAPLPVEQAQAMRDTIPAPPDHQEEPSAPKAN